MRGFNLLWVVLAISVGVALFVLKYQVQIMEDRLVRLNKEIRQSQETIHVLRSEWAYLNDPERLRELNDRYTKLNNVGAKNIALIEELPLRAGGR